MSQKQSVIVVTGPTASGKTALAIKLSELLGGEIVSADSMLIYKGMPIASAAPTAEETARIPHHLTQFLSPSERFSVADYVNLAERKIAEIASRSKLPVIVGGTGLYIDSLISGVNFSEEENVSVRAELEAEADKCGMEKMLVTLRQIDPECAGKLHINDRKRILRALEIYRIHGKTPTEMKALSKQSGARYKAVWIGINYRDREKLYDRINLRVDRMLKEGLLTEAKTAYDSAFSKTSAQAIGHKEFFPYFRGEITLSEAVERLKAETRHYAKRQLTWFGKNSEINWIYADETEDITEKALEIIKKGL